MFAARLTILCLVLAMLVTGPSAHSQDGDFCVSVWYPSSEDPTGYDSLMQNADIIHEVNPFWYNPSLDGTLLPRLGAEDEEKLTEWREAGLVIMPTIVSFEGSGMIETPELRRTHIDEIVALVERMDYDGIDIDYEGFALDTRDAYSTFIEDLAGELHDHDKLLSMAVHAKTADVAEWDAATAQDWERLAAAVDVFRIMTYDYHNRASDAGPIAPLDWVLDVIEYASTVTDLNKVRLGLHFYGYSWQRGNTAVITWKTVSQWLTSFELEFERDPADMEAFLTLSLRGLPRQTAYVADSVGLDYKLSHMLAEYPELGGVAIWGIGGEDPANWDVLRGLSSTCSLKE
ncbi:MAG: glycosyl hydrolase family 18 protein [Chloroflexi bacterium]|nr:glycosyl hydrolase family 18 protein [Chloroflexota bacterium]